MISVIIADDDYSVRHGLANHIPWKELGAEIIMLAENGAEVVDKLAECDVDLIISDIRMPIMDGLELLRYVRANGFSVDMVLLSAYAEFEYAREAISLGVKEYIVKPITRDKLTRIENFIKRLVTEKNMTEKVMFSVYEKEFQRRFIEAVSNHDTETIKHFFVLDDDFSNLTLYKEYCVTLIELLPDFTSDEKNELMAHLAGATSINESRQLMLEKTTEKQIRSTVSKGVQTVKNIIGYVTENYCSSDLNVQSIANHFNLSPEYVSTLFKSENGNSLSDWITGFRVSKSAEFLSGTGMTVSQIAHEVGYEDVRYFMRLFKKRMGMTPTQYRTKVQTEVEV